MSKRRLRNSIDENTQTSFSSSSESDSGEHWTDKYFDTMSDHGEDVDALGNNEVNVDEVPEGNPEDEAVVTARQAVDRANAVLMAVPAAAQVAAEADATARCMAQMLHAMQLQNAQSQLQTAQSQLQYAQARLEDKRQQQKFILQQQRFQ
jgi:hypothetical protein